MKLHCQIARCPRCGRNVKLSRRSGLVRRHDGGQLGDNFWCPGTGGQPMRGAK